jgi:4-amino-4-deoxy-L-arabinose transferase-like glycosyltransferase
MIFSTSDLLFAVSIVCPLMGVVLVLATYKLAEDLFGWKSALAASTLVALSPHLLSISFTTEPEIMYAAFLVVSLMLFSKAVQRKLITYAGLSGVTFALAYLSRSEGFLIMVFVLGCTVVCQGRLFYRSPISKLCCIVLICFFTVASPYLLFLKKQYGAFVISPKSSYVLLWMKGREAHRQDALNPDMWGLTPSGRLKWQEPRGLSDLAAYLMADPGKNISVYFRNLSNELPGRIPYNSGMEKFPNLIPVYLFLAALASVALNWGSLQKEKKIILLSPLLIFLVLPVFTDGWWKYLVPYQPIFMLLAAQGITGWSSRLGRFAENRSVLAENLLIVLAIGAITLSYYVALHPRQDQQAAPSTFNSLRANEAMVSKELGMLASQRFGPGRNYMVKWSKLVYYLDGYWTALPIASFHEIHKYAKAHQVDYVVFQARTAEEMDLINHPLPGFKLVETIASQEYYYKLAFYRPID